MQDAEGGETEEKEKGAEGGERDPKTMGAFNEETGEINWDCPVRPPFPSFPLTSHKGLTHDFSSGLDLKPVSGWHAPRPVWRAVPGRVLVLCLQRAGAKGDRVR